MTPSALASVLDAAGTAQPDRLPAALREGAVRVDERSLEDLLAWARRYARLVRFPSVDGAVGGDWSAFLADDPTVLVATIAQADAAGARATVEAARADLLAADSADRQAPAAAFLDAAAGLAVTLGGWRRRAAPGSGLRAALDRLAETSVGRAAGDLHGLALAAEARGLSGLPRGLAEAAADLAATGRATPGTDPSVLPDPDAAPDAITPADLDAFADRVAQSADALAAATGYLAGQAPALLAETLETGRHEPHVALFLAFLLLFRHAQAHVNAFGERHLQWTYRDVLGLAPHAPEPESVRVVFELARNAQPHLLPAGTLLRGDKDDDGVERLYATDDDVVVTAARVERLLALRVDAGGSARLPKAPAQLVVAEASDRLDGLALAGNVWLLRAPLGEFDRRGFEGPRVDLEFEPLGVTDPIAVNLQSGGIAWPRGRELDAKRAAVHTAALGPPVLLAVSLPDRPDTTDSSTSGSPGKPGTDASPTKPGTALGDLLGQWSDRVVGGAVGRGVEDYLHVGDTLAWDKAPAAPVLGEPKSARVVGSEKPATLGEYGLFDTEAEEDGRKAQSAGKSLLGADEAENETIKAEALEAQKREAERARGEGADAEKAEAEKQEAEKERARAEAGKAEAGPLPFELSGLTVRAVVALSETCVLVWAADAHADDVLAAAAAEFPHTPAVAVDLARGDIAWAEVDGGAEAADLLAPTTPEASPGVWAAPAADSGDGVGGEITRDDGSWAPFGDDATPAARLGIAVAADVLRLAEGTRRVRLGLRVDALAPATRADLDAARAELAANLRVEVTTEKGWAAVPIEAVALATAEPTITLELTLAGDAPAVVAYDEAVHLLGLDAELPVLRIECVDGYAARARTADDDGLSLPFVPTPDTVAPFVLGEDVVTGDLRTVDGRVYVARTDRAGQTEPAVGGAWIEATKAHPLRHLGPPQLLGVTVGVAVEGLRTLVAQGDGAGLDPAKAVAPFGMRARRGARFVVASPELQKPLTSVHLRLAWEGLPPETFAAYYDEYAGNGVTAPTTASFVADTAILDGGAWRTLQTGVRLFDDVGGVPQAPWSLTVPVAAAPADAPAPFDALGPGVRSGAVQLTLRQSFLHEVYPKRLAEIAIAGAPGTVTLPNPPYTPLAADLAVDYTATAAVHLGDDAGGVALYHLGPFGAAPIALAIGAEREAGELLVRHTILPRFGVAPYGGPSAPLVAALYVGLAAANPPETASLLIQTAPGTADPEATPPEVIWQVLEGDTWRSLAPDEVLADTTGGLVRSGIVRVALARAVDAEHRLLPTGLRWLRAAVAAAPDALDRVVAIRAQAVRATRVAGAAPVGVVEAGTVGKLKTRPPAVKGVEQPFASVGGREAEGRDAFVRRVHERLGHRARAVTPADYERIALEAFPTLHRVRCAPHTLVRATGTPDSNAPGSVVVVVVPDVRQTAVRDPLRPRVSQGQLAEVRAVLVEAAADAVAVDVRNPAYEPVRVEARLQFRPGVDVGYGLRAVEAAVVDALAPWHDDGDVRFGGRVHRSHVLRLLEAHESVDAVRDLRVTDAAGADVTVAEASSPLAVLTSAPTHAFTEWTPEPCPTTSPSS